MKTQALWKHAQFAHRKHWPCRYCGALLTVETATVDHIKPKALGGKNRPKNFALACLRCNQKKADSYHGTKRNIDPYATDPWWDRATKAARKEEFIQYYSADGRRLPEVRSLLRCLHRSRPLRGCYGTGWRTSGTPLCPPQRRCDADNRPSRLAGYGEEDACRSAADEGDDMQRRPPEGPDGDGLRCVAREPGEPGFVRHLQEKARGLPKGCGTG